MFCRVEILNRDASGKKRIVFARYKSAASLVEMMAFADHECAKRGAAGYRLRDLHTAEVKEVWD